MNIGNLLNRRLGLITVPNLQKVVTNLLETIGFTNNTLPDSRPYKVYTALLSQTGTNAPVATVLENTLGGTVVWTRDGVGVYFGTLEGAFPSGKCVPYCQYSPQNWNSISFTTERNDDDSIVVNLEGLADGLPIDISDTGYSTYTEIRVYN